MPDAGLDLNCCTRLCDSARSYLAGAFDERRQVGFRQVMQHLNMPGYGRSEKRAGQRTSLDVQTEVFLEVLAHWKLSRPLVVAHDFGGQ
jgi:pimeloyl-ACP methyl ester carboxylesterase